MNCYQVQMSFLKDKENEIKSKIRNLYLNILLREPDDIGLTHYLELAVKEKTSLSEIETKIRNSDEARNLRENKELDIEMKRLFGHSKNAPKFSSSFSNEEIKKMVDSVTWYHTIEINGIRPSEIRTSLEYQMWAAQAIPEDLSGKSVLDIGTADGFYSFLAESRGATRVLSLDFMKWEGYDVAKKILNSKAEHKIMNVEDLDLLNEKFDIVIFFGVYYHLKNPIDVLEKIFRKTKEKTFLAGHIIDAEEPLMCYYDEYEMHPNDKSNWWAASPSCIIQASKRIGFKDAKIVDRMFMKQMLNFQTEETKNSIRRLGHIGTFELIK